MDNIIAILECLRDFIVARDCEKSFDMSTALLLEMIEVLGFDSPLMVKLFPLLEQLKNDVQQHKFDDALPKVLALLANFRQPQQQDRDDSSTGSDVGSHALRTTAVPDERNHTSSETGGREGGRGSYIESNVVRLPLAVHHLDIAAKLTAPGNQDIDSVSAGIERVQLGLPGSYLVVTWVTRVTPTRYLDSIWYLSSFGDESSARKFVSSALDQLIAGGSKLEPSAKAHGPRLEESDVSVLARTSLNVSEEGKPEEDHVTFIVLGRFPAAIVSVELVELFGDVREKRALKDFFAFHGPDSVVPPEWLDQDLSPEEPGNLAWTLAALTPLVGSEKEQLEWAESRIEKFATDSGAESQTTISEAAGSVETNDTSHQFLRGPDSCSLEYWREFMLSYYPGTTFHDSESAFRLSKPFTMAPEVEKIIKGYTLEWDSTVLAIKEGAVLGWWLDEYHSYVVRQLPKAAGATPSAHVEIIAFGESSTPASTTGSDDQLRSMVRRLYMESSSLVSPAERAAFLRGGFGEVEKLKREEKARADSEAAAARHIRSLKDILDGQYTVEEARRWFDARWYPDPELRSDYCAKRIHAMATLTAEQRAAVDHMHDDMVLTICYPEWDSVWNDYRDKGQKAEDWKRNEENRKLLSQWKERHPNPKLGDLLVAPLEVVEALLGKPRSDTLGQDSASPSTASGTAPPSEVAASQALLNDYLERKSQPLSPHLQAKQARLAKKLFDLFGSSES